MSTVTPIGCTRLGEYVMDRELDALDEARLRADDIDTEARNAVTYQEWLEQMAELKPSQQTAVVNALLKGDRLSTWFIEITVATAFERAVQTKIKEL